MSLCLPLVGGSIERAAAAGDAPEDHQSSVFKIGLSRPTRSDCPVIHAVLVAMTPFSERLFQ